MDNKPLPETPRTVLQPLRPASCRTAHGVRCAHGARRAPRAHGAPHLKQQNTLEPCIYATHLEQVVETNQEGANKSFLCETSNFHNEKTGVRGLR